MSVHKEDHTSYQIEICTYTVGKYHTCIIYISLYKIKVCPFYLVLHPVVLVRSLEVLKNPFDRGGDGLRIMKMVTKHHEYTRQVRRYVIWA